MISSNLAFNQSIYNLALVHRNSSLEDSELNVSKEIVETCKLENFPGALFPKIEEHGDFNIVIAFERFADWYKVSPIIKAFCGKFFKL